MFLLILASLSPGNDPEPTTVEPTYEFQLKGKNDNTIVAVKEKTRTTFIVTNAFGIGEGTINLKAGEWPENVTLRFLHNKEVGFTNLEHLTLSTNRIFAEGSLKQSGQFVFCFRDDKQKKPEVFDERRAAGTLKILVEQRQGAIEVTLPSNLLAGSSQLTAYWIDAYRR